MDMSTIGRTSRKSRVTENNNGTWGSSSQDFVRLAYLLFKSSKEYAEKCGGNCSPYSLAGIPVLLSALRALLIEVNTTMYGKADCPQRLERIVKNEIAVLLNEYPIPAPHKLDLELLVEVRNEMVHPAHRPGPERNNTPEYLSPLLKEKRLLESTGMDCDYLWINQLQSHRLFKWAFEIMEATVEIILGVHEFDADTSEGLRNSYSRYRDGGANEST